MVQATAALEELVAMPDSPGDRDRAWTRLTSGSMLFNALKRGICGPRAIDWGAVHLWLNRWSDEWVRYVAEDGSLESVRLNELLALARKLIHCAQNAMEEPNAFRGEIDAVCRRLGRQAFDEEEWGWSRTFLDHLPSGTSHTPVVLMDKSGKAAFMATLELEVLQEGAGTLSLHPQDALGVRFVNGFIESMQAAWNLVREELGKIDDAVLRCDGRWRLDSDLARIPDPVEGESASGAAARGWWFALQRKVDDDRVCVLAKVGWAKDKGCFRWSGVDHVREKIQAIIAQGRIDTVVVVKENEKDARQALSGSRSLRSITIDPRGD